MKLCVFSRASFPRTDGSKRPNPEVFKESFPARPSGTIRSILRAGELTNRLVAADRREVASAGGAQQNRLPRQEKK